MTKNYTELIEYLGEKFDWIERKFQSIDQKFVLIDHRFESIDQRFESIGHSFNSIDQRFDNIDGNISQLPTKAYLDDKLADLEGRLNVKLRKEDSRVGKLTKILHNKKILSGKDISELDNLQVFQN
jgi:UDP-N-acetylglucosamine 2-epimerase